MARDIRNGRWFTVQTPQQHKTLKQYGALTPPAVRGGAARVQMGEWRGPGRYMLLEYQQRCPRGCCYDDVCEVVPAAEVVEEAREGMRELANILRDAKSV